MKEASRLFLAIYPNKEIIDALVKFKNIINNEKINWINKDNYHITVFFLGNVKKTLMPELIHELNLAFNNINKFLLKFKKINLIPNSINPKIIWAEFENNANFEKLVQISKNVCSKYQENKLIKHQKKIIPHITLGRIKKNSFLNIKITKQPKINNIFVDTCLLVKSELNSQGSNYKKIAVFKLN